MVITLVNCKFYVESGDKDDKRNIKHIARDIYSRRCNNPNNEHPHWNNSNYLISSLFAILAPNYRCPYYTRITYYTDITKLSCFLLAIYFVVNP